MATGFWGGGDSVFDLHVFSHSILGLPWSCMIAELNKFLGDWQYIWFFLILACGLAVELHSNYVLRKEYEYDEQKDLAKKQKRTRTTKKTTTDKAGLITTEETNETVEPIVEEKK